MSRPNRYRTDRRSRQRSASAEPDETTPEADRPRSGPITAIRTQQRDQERVSVFLDDVFAFGLDQQIVLDRGLHTGQTLTEADTAELLALDETSRATAAALQFLGYRPRSEGEIQRRLRQRGFAQPAIDTTLDKLRGWRYVDDSDFAERWIENRLVHRPRSARLLAQELRQKGVDAGTAAGAIDEAAIDEVADATALAADKMRKLSNLPDDVRTRRVTGFLARRGYGFGVIRAALDGLVDSADPAGIDIDPGDDADPATDR
ncbi:MAG TPA: RecX family transcriptional regulator [Thermomicrobiales bacterium]|nr:RecX family transcriptional regulator [Thermomicrobiales bacterium]